MIIILFISAIILALLLNEKLDPKFKIGPIQELWLQSLENNPERQGHGFLGKMNEDGNYNACCLGEYGLIAGVCIWSDNFLVETEGKSGAFLRNSYEELGLYSSIGSSNINCIYTSDGRSLAHLNDFMVSWPKIAKIIRANPEHYLNKSI